MSIQSFLDLPNSEPGSADVLLLPLPYEGTVSYGTGTAAAPEAIWTASQHVECWDDEMNYALDSLRFHSASPLVAERSEDPGDYLLRVNQRAIQLRKYGGLPIGVGGEHSVTAPLAIAASDNAEDLSRLTVVHFDAHADLRREYTSTPQSHACVMRRIVEKGARLVSVGIRSAERAEWEYGRNSERVQTFGAQHLADGGELEKNLLECFLKLRGALYLTIDIDVLDPVLCPSTGTPQPGGLSWWQCLRYLRCLLYENRHHKLVGCDLVETVPAPHTRVNEFTAARLLSKVIAYRFAS